MMAYLAAVHFGPGLSETASLLPGELTVRLDRQSFDFMVNLKSSHLSGREACPFNFVFGGSLLSCSIPQFDYLQFRYQHV
jgi:hypothetical protein